MSMKEQTKKMLTINDFKNTILSDYRLVSESREASLLGRRDVLSGKGSFGIFGDGKELAQIALSKVFRNGDFRAGYYRDQTSNDGFRTIYNKANVLPFIRKS